MEKEKLGAMQAHLAGKMALTKAPSVVSHPRPDVGTDCWGKGVGERRFRVQETYPYTQALGSPDPCSQLQTCPDLRTYPLALINPLTLTS